MESGFHLFQLFWLNIVSLCSSGRPQVTSRSTFSIDLNESYNHFRLKKKFSERATYLSLLEHPFLQHHAMVNTVSGCFEQGSWEWEKRRFTIK